MKKVSKRIISSLLAVMMIATLLSGCGSKETDSTTPTAAPTTGAASTDGTTTVTEAPADVPQEVTTFTFYNADGEEDPWTDPVALAITEKTGVKLQTDYPVGDDDQKVSLMIASGEYPDLIFAKGDSASLVEAGALIDMRDLIDQYGPNIKALYGDYYSHLQYSTDDPAIYQLCYSEIWGKRMSTGGTCQLQYAVMAENGYAVPRTLAEYEAYIKDYLAKNPTIDGQETIGISLSCADWHWYITLANPSGFIANASPDNGQWIIDDANNYQATYKHAAENQKEYYQWLNRMYLEGVLDQDFATQTHDDYIAKLASGRVLAIMDADWDYIEPEQVLTADGKYDRTYCALPVTMYADQKAPTLIDQGPSFGWGVGITTACEDPVKAVKFLDFLCSDEGQVLTHWGIEGVNYFIDENGKRYRTEEEILRSQTDVDYKRTTGVDFHKGPFPRYGDGAVDSTGNTYTKNGKEAIIAEYNEADRAALAAWGVELLVDIFPQADEFPVSPYSPVWAQNLPAEFNDIATVLDEVAWSGLIKCVMAPEGQFDTEWDALQQGLIDANREEAEAMLTEMIQAQAEAYQ